MTIKCIIPAGGKGLRLRPYTADVPKPLVEVNNKPLLYYTFQTLKKLHIRDVILVNGYKAEMIEDYVNRNAQEFNVVCIKQKENEMLGLPSAILSAEREIDDTFIMLLPDFIFTEDMSHVIKKHQKLNADSTIVLTKGMPLINCGSFELKNDFITSIKLNKNNSEKMYDYLALGMDVQEPDFIDSCKELKLSKRGQYEIVEAYINRLNSGKKLVGAIAKTKAFHITEPKDKYLFEGKNE